MIYVVHYFDDNHKPHMAFVKSFKDVEFLRERFGEITVEAYKNEQMQICNYFIYMYNESPII